VLIDGTGGDAYRGDLKRTIKACAAPGAMADVRLVDSRADPLIQLADMCIGAIARPHRDRSGRGDRWRASIADKIEAVLIFN
jgi:hypothetical protein